MLTRLAILAKLTKITKLTSEWVQSSVELYNYTMYFFLGKNTFFSDTIRVFDKKYVLQKNKHVRGIIYLYL